MTTTRPSNALRALALLVSLACIPCAGSAVAAEIGPTSGACSYYADALQGKPVASGEKYDKNALTAAHRTLPFGTMLKVTNVKNQKSVVVRVNDRGPHGKNKRIIDVSRAAADRLGMIDAGTAEVTIEVVASATP